MTEPLDRTARDNWILRVLHLDVRGAATHHKSQGGGAQAQDHAKTALAVWRSTRANVVTQLQTLGRAIQSGGDPEARDAVDLIATLIGTLPEQPVTAQNVDELESYLVTDDVIDAAEMPSIYGPALRVRAPLLQALGEVKRALSN